MKGDKHDENYYIDQNGYSFALVEKRVGEPSGKEYFKNKGYYADLDACLKGYTRVRLMGEVGNGDEIKPLGGFIEKLKELEKAIEGIGR